MVVQLSDTDSSDGSGPSSRPNHVTSPMSSDILDDLISSSGEQNAKKPKNKKKKLKGKDQIIHDLRREVEKKEGEVHAKDNLLKEKDAELEKKEGEVRAKDNLLKEKDAELTNCRRNLDHCETEKRKLETEKLKLQEEHRASQERISWENNQLKRESNQLRMDLARFDAWNRQQSFTIHSLQSRLNGCEGQLHQLSRDYQLQVALLESFDRHAHERQRELDGATQTIQALTDELRTLQNHSMDVTQLGQNNGNQQLVNRDVAMNTNAGVLANGNVNNATSFVSSGNASTQAASEVSQISAPSQTDQDLAKSDAKDEPDKSVDGQALHSGNMDVYTSLETEPDSVILPSAEAASEVSQISASSQTDQDLTKSDAKDEHDTSVDGQVLHSGNLDVQQDSVISPSAEVEQVLSQENGANTISIQWGSSPFTSEIPLGTLETEQ